MEFSKPIIDPQISQAEYAVILSELTSLIRYPLENYSKSFIIRRLEARIRRTFLHTLKEYFSYLRNNPGEIKLFLDDLSIHVTHFFRDRVMYDTFMLESLFELMKNKDDSHNKKLRVWSAGCSSGEEVYSIAIILLELLGNRIKDFSVSVLGTDIDKDAIDMAKIGVYHEEQFKECDPLILKKYFRQIDGSYEVIPQVRALVSFELNDMLSSLKPKGFDVIFCRNVVIYFSPEIKEKLFNDFYESLNHKGFLVIGKTETLTGPAKDKFKMKSLSERIYMKE
jgi:chemotaxis protein methyltransferase CheR